jgi:hypothetical protein
MMVGNENKPLKTNQKEKEEPSGQLVALSRPSGHLKWKETVCAFNCLLLEVRCPAPSTAAAYSSLLSDTWTPREPHRHFNCVALRGLSSGL